MKKRFFGLFFSFFVLITLAAVERAQAYTLDDATALYNMGIDYYSQNQVQKSMDYFKKAISIDPKFYEAYYNLAQIQASYGYTDAAIKSYEKVVQLKPDDYESIYELGRLLYKRGYLSRALTYLDRVPPSADISAQAVSLEKKIKKRQAELALIAKQKEEAKLAQAKQAAAAQSETAQIQETKVSAVEKSEPAFENSNIIISLQEPSGVASDSNGNIYAASFSENKIYKITPAGEKSVYVWPVNLGGPIGLALDSADNLYVANYTKNNILKVTPSGVMSEFATLKKPYCLSVDHTRNILVVSEQDSNNIVKFKL